MDKRSLHRAIVRTFFSKDQDNGVDVSSHEGSSLSSYQEDDEGVRSLQREITNLKLRGSQPLDNVLTASSSTPTRLEDKEKELLVRRILLLESEIKAVKMYPYTVPQQNVDRLRHYTAERIKCSVHRLESLTSKLKASLAETERAISKQQQLLQEYTGIKEGLTQRLSELNSQFPENPSEAENIQSNLAKSDMKQKLKTLSSTNKRLLNYMRVFLDKYYPVPTLRDLEGRVHGAKAKKTLEDFFPKQKGSSDQHRRRTRQNEASNRLPHTANSVEVDSENDEDSSTSDSVPVMSLRDLLENLMNLCVSRPHDPFLRIDPDKHWMPYLEMLHRAGIIQHHPKNPEKIKLTEFHQFDRSQPTYTQCTSTLSDIHQLEGFDVGDAAHSRCSSSSGNRNTK
eukprot:gene3239-5949_t